MENYKLEIEQTRTGHLGSSDAKMVAMIDSLGDVPRSCYERLAIAKGIKENNDHVYTEAMRMGDRIENEIYEYLTSSGKPYESNPMWVSELYSRPNIKCISHPDYVLQDENEKTLYVYEVKASKYSTQQVRQEYKCQLYWHYKLAMERAANLGKDWKVKIFLVHYNTEFIDDFDTHVFELDRLEIKEVRFQAPLFDLANGMDIISKFLDGFEVFYESEEIDADMLPELVYKQFISVCDSLTKIKEMEIGIDAFKQHIYEFMSEKNIKSIKNDVFTITRVDPSESVSFDFKRYLDDYAKDHPTKARALQKKYEKRTQRKGYATIKIKK